MQNSVQDYKYLQRIFKRIALAYAVLIGVTVMIYLMIPILNGTWVTPLYAWQPCNISLTICFWTCYIHQTIGTVTLATIHVACDTLATGFMLQICAQLNVLSHRVLSINSKIHNFFLREKDKSKILLFESFLSNACIADHNDILRFTKLLSETFIQVLFVQFCASLTVICSSVYMLSILKVSSLDFIELALYLLCMLNQLLLYCWYGNEVLLNSKKLFQSIYNVDWITLHGKTQKTLLLMMLAASSPIQLFKGAIIKVDLDTYLKVLKFSYSAFNILRNPSDNFNE